MSTTPSFADLVRLPLPDPHACICEDAGAQARAPSLPRCVPLTQGHFALVDAQDYEWVMRWHWFAHRRRKAFYATRNKGNGQLLMHREILVLRMGIELSPGRQVDHKNRDTLDNRRENLRACSASENAMNRRKKAGCTSRFVGVHWNTRSKKWAARINRSHHLGYFSSEVDAALAYDQAARKYHGEFATLNFPDTTTYSPRPMRPKTSRYRGVSWSADENRWEARIQKGKRHYFLGYFHGEIEAAHAYDTRARELHGNSAVTNSPNPAWLLEVEEQAAAEGLTETFQAMERGA